LLSVSSPCRPLSHPAFPPLSLHDALPIFSCPCALVISIPLSFFAGIGGASNAGVLVKGSNYLEILSQAKYVVFDKTGTLTQGVLDRKSTRLNSSHVSSSYAVFCLNIEKMV